MPAPENIDAFARFIALGGLLPQEQLVSYLQSLQEAGALPYAPAELAKRMIADGLLTNFQAEQLLIGKYRGFTLGKYEILERIGEGGMGAVYLSVHRGMNRRVALKVMSEDAQADPGLVERFYREARAAAALDHPNIASAHDVDHHGDLHFLVMEFIDGVDLYELVGRRGPLPSAQAAHYLRQAADGLQHAHERKLVHRDIKPGNLMVNRQGVVKILDMGLARFFQDKAEQKEGGVGSVFGTLDYISPEQALNSHDVDIRADIYSLGATLFFLLTGRPPFGGGTTAEKLMWHQLRQPDDVRTLRADVPAGLAAVVARMLAKEPGQRFQTPAEVGAALAPFAAPSAPVPPAALMPQWCRAAAAGGGAVPPEALAFAARRRPAQSAGLPPPDDEDEPEVDLAEAKPQRRPKDPRRERLQLIAAAAVCLFAVSAMVCSWLFTYGPLRADAPKEVKFEAESLRLLRKSSEFGLAPQPMAAFKTGKWGGDAQLWGSPPGVGSIAELLLTPPADGKYHVIVRFTRAADYEIVRLSVDGKPLGNPFDAYAPTGVLNSDLMDLGVVDLKKGAATLRIETTGTNPASTGARYMWGLDCVILKPD